MDYLTYRLLQDSWYYILNLGLIVSAIGVGMSAIQIVNLMQEDIEE